MSDWKKEALQVFSVELATMNWLKPGDRSTGGTINTKAGEYVLAITRDQGDDWSCLVTKKDEVVININMNHYEYSDVFDLAIKAIKKSF